MSDNDQMQATGDHLLIIDPQEDFCNPDKGTLYVKGAETDMTKLADFVRRGLLKLKALHVTLDAHHYCDVAHKYLIVDSKGNQLNPEKNGPILIKHDQFRNGEFVGINPAITAHYIEYTSKLEAGGRYPFIVWPDHCIIGTPGGNIFSELIPALAEWATTNKRWIKYVTKGSNPKTEHYSPLKAEVEDPKDPSTKLNTKLISLMTTADRVFVAGEALDYCLGNGLRDIVANFGVDLIKKLYVLEDATSPVHPDRKLADALISEMKTLGVNFIKTTDVY